MKNKKKTKPLGLIFYKGSSLIDGAPIVGIITGLSASSKNEKTGNMLQTYILRSDVSPIDAIKTGADISICGTCPHRPTKNGTCYVNVAQGPTMVYKAFRRGAYTFFNSRQSQAANYNRLQNRSIRCGSYGDPTAIPFFNWELLLKTCDGHTGYTHQWRTCDPTWRDYIMASADNTNEQKEAMARGWRTFRVSGVNKSAGGDILCPASIEAGKKTNCANCMLCSGANKQAKSIYIPVHGLQHKINKFQTNN